MQIYRKPSNYKIICTSISVYVKGILKITFCMYTRCKQMKFVLKVNSNVRKVYMSERYTEIYIYLLTLEFTIV